MRARHRTIAALVTLAGLLARVPAPRAQEVLPTGFADSLLVGGLSYPTGFTFLPDGRVLVVEQMSARIRLIANGALAPGDPVVQLTDVRNTGGEQGLLGIAVDPGWPGRPYLYTHQDRAGAATIRISRYTAAGDLTFTGNGSLSVDDATRYDLLDDAPDNAPNHNGGTLRFGTDGMLYASLGDDAASCAAQDTVSLRGVILRLDVSRLPATGAGPAPRALVTPADNPFVTHPNPNAGLVWELGLRNPFRFQVDPLDGSLWIGDVGERRFEELDHATAGGQNFGWPLYEAVTPYLSTCPNAHRGTDPVYFYDRNGFTAATDALGIYRRPPLATRPFPAEYEGNLFVGDYYAGFLRRLVFSGGTWQIAPPALGQPQPGTWATGITNVSEWAVGPDGAIWYCRQANDNFDPGSGEIRRIVVMQGAPIAGVPTELMAPVPSPAPGQVRFDWVLPAATRVELTLYDLSGRQVRRLVFPEDEGAGPHAVTWDGLAEDGGSVRAGIYIARLIAGGRASSRRVPLLR